jgi:hypothetical protein
MSTEQIPEVSGEDSSVVPPQTASKPEWPKKIRTLTAAELDRLTIDGGGRFYWDGKPVAYEGPPTKPAEARTTEAVDVNALEILDRAAMELSGSKPADPAVAAELAQAMEPGQTAPDSKPGEAVVIPAAAVAPVMDARRARALAAAAAGRPETVRISLSFWQSLALLLLILGFLTGAAGIAAQGLVAANDWGCKVGWVKTSCPPPPPAPRPPARADIPA